MAQLPDVPTVAEQGYPGFEMTQWYRLLAPASRPNAVVERLAQVSLAAVRQPAALEKPTADAAIALGSGPAEFSRFIATEQQRWKQVIARAKIKSDRGQTAGRQADPTGLTGQTGPMDLKCPMGPICTTAPCACRALA